MGFGGTSRKNFKRKERKLRYLALKTYGNKCACCGAGPEAQLHVDHIKPKSRYPELAMSLHNLQILCKACNEGKSNWDETKWRE